jgi:hypothetical protein
MGKPFQPAILYPAKLSLKRRDKDFFRQTKIEEIYC